MSAVARIATGALDKAIFGGAPDKLLDDMTIEELEERFRIMQERLRSEAQ